MSRLERKVAIVTGAGRGIGAATASLLAEEGATVLLTDLRDEAEIAADEIVAAGGRARFIKHDVTREGDWQRVVGIATEKLGGLHILVNNAAMWAANETETTEVEFFDKMVAVNLKGVFLGCKYAIGAMKSLPPDGDAGVIVNFSSVSGIVGSSQSPLYGMTKGGVRALSKAVALEVRERGYNIRCNSIHPGLVKTPMLDEIYASTSMTSTEREEYERGRNPLGRGASTREIAQGVLFLVSAESSFVTGTELVVDGGFTAR